MHAVAGYVTVSVGAGVGGAMRHGGNVAASRLIGSVLPYGTLFTNAVGSLVMGLLAGRFALKFDPGNHGDFS